MGSALLISEDGSITGGLWERSGGEGHRHVGAQSAWALPLAPP